jgi:hypothetical protein
MISVKKKDLIKIINEEVSNFDFLGNDAYLKEQEVLDLLSNEDFQKQFICDSLLSVSDNKKTARNSKIGIKVEDASIGGNWEDDFDDASYITLDYNLEITYKYDQYKEPLKFNLFFNSDRISIGKGGYYDPGNWGGTMADAIEPSGEAYFNYLDWDDVEVSLFSSDGDEIKFTAFQRAPHNIRTLFIKEYTEGYIESNSLGIEDNSREFKNLSKAPYC